MAFCYALVSRGSIPLCQHCAVPGNFDLYYQKFLPKENNSETITMHQVDGYIWGIKSNADDLNILCVVRENCDRSLIVKILKEIENRFLKIYQEEWKKASTFSLQASFEPNLINICKIFQQKEQISLAEIIPPSMNEIGSSDVDEYTLLNPKNGKNPQIRKIQRKAKNTKMLIMIISIIIFIIFLIYLIFTFQCGGWSLSACL